MKVGFKFKNPRALAGAALALVASAALIGAAPPERRPVPGFRCNTHTHTSAKPGSDANETPVFVAGWYKAHGYSCLVITDHENQTDVAPVNAALGEEGRFLVLPGQEITQALASPDWPGGVRHLHVNGLGVDRLIMPLGAPGPARGIAAKEAYLRNLQAVREAGGVPQVNHPNLVWSVRFEDLAPLKGPYLFEVWNGYPTSNNLGGTDDQGHVSPSAEALWDQLLTAGQVVWAVGADDAHDYHRMGDREAPGPGKAWVVVDAPTLSQTAILDALKAGRFYASTGIALSGYEVTRTGVAIHIAPPVEWSPAVAPSARYRTRFFGAGGKVLATVTGSNPAYTFKGGEGYVRASIEDTDGRRGWTQPVFLDGRTGSRADYRFGAPG